MTASDETTAGARAGHAPGIRCQVLFVCSGNTCRSPLAAAILRDLLPAPVRGRVEVLSAGTGAAAGEPASPGALEVAGDHGLELAGHRAARLTRELVVDSDFIFAMEASHRAAALRIAPAAGERVHLIRGFAGCLAPGEGPGVADPIGGNRDAYEATYLQLRDAIESSLARIVAAAEGAP